jgi:hypothetical protein
MPESNTPTKSSRALMPVTALSGAVLTSAWGINSVGQIVGDYRLADNAQHGFLAQPGNKAKPQ